MNSSSKGLTQRRRVAVSVALAVSTLMIVWCFSSHSAYRTASTCDTENTHADRVSEAFAVLDGLNEEWERSKESWRAKYESTNTLIMVAAHGVFAGKNPEEWEREENWALETHQKGKAVSAGTSFGMHVQRGLLELKDKLDTSLLIFSGGESRVSTGPRSEALSYYVVAEVTNLFNVFDTAAEGRRVLRERIFCEPYARDSFENLLFSICRFYEITGRVPEAIIVIGWEHKADRFTQLHREALRFPRNRFRYIGLGRMNATSKTSEQNDVAIMSYYSDRATYAKSVKDPYLCRAHRETRLRRDPQHKTIPYLLSCPPLRWLLIHCGPKYISRDRVPW